MISELEEVARNNHIVLWSRINKIASWMSLKFEGGGDVVGVLTVLVGGVAQAFHDDRVVELRVQLGVEDVEG